MKTLLAIVMLLGFVIMPFAVYAQLQQPPPGAPPMEQPGGSAPPISQTLVAEGDFAMQLAPALKLGKPATEAQATDMLTKAGVIPRNGWIADYPMTPIVIGEVQDAIVSAAVAKKLPVGKDEALKAFQSLTAEAGLAISPAGPGAGPGQYPEGPYVEGPYAEGQPPASSPYVESPEVEDYYAQEGPPVVTYYPPPWDYDYLYSWVPYPFWDVGFFFPGFFILNDFSILVGGHFGYGHFFQGGPGFHHLITNHFIDPRTHASFRVDPTTRTMERPVSSFASHGGGFGTPGARSGAASIFNRSAGRAGMTDRGFAGAQPQGRPFAPSGRSFGPSSRGFSRPGGVGRPFSPRSGSFGAPHTSMANRSFGSLHGGGGFGGFHGGSSHGGGGGRGHR